MTLLELAEQHVPMRKVGNEWHGPCPACGTSQNDPRMSDRFTVKPDRGIFFCRTCTPDGGGAVTFLRKFENKSCPEAHALLGQACDSANCPARDKCSQGQKGSVAPAPRALHAPKPAEAPAFVPVEATSPADLWRTRATKLIDHAHAALLDCPAQLDYLARRGLPLAAVEKYRLGWLAEDLYRPRSAWGLPEMLREQDGKPKKLWIPQGIVIPFFGSDENPFRIRIRRAKVKEGEARYYWLPGSGDDVPVLGSDSRAFVVVESDLDAFLVHWQAGGLVGAIPLGTCSAKPKEAAMAALDKALAILVALDGDAAGIKSAKWWLQHFPRAKRWPVLSGKDPGEFYQNGGDIRRWVLAGLPPVFHIAIVPSAKKDEKPEVSAPEPVAPVIEEPAGYMRGISKLGRAYMVVQRPESLALLRETFHDDIPVLESELSHLKGFTAEEADQVLMLKSVFPDSRIVAVRPITGDGLPENVIKFDPSRQRAMRQGRG